MSACRPPTICHYQTGSAPTRAWLLSLLRRLDSLSPGTVSAAEPPVAVEYQSSFAGYRRFDAQAPAVAWRQANDAIGNVSEGATHGMHGMLVPAEPAPADTNESPPTTSGDHREHRQ